MDKVDITIIGAGVIGLANAYYLASQGREVLIVERHHAFGQETSSRNSEVIHAGLYYPPDSLKARMCIRGKELLYRLCAENNITHKQLGKLIVAQEKVEIDKLHKILQNAEASGVTNLRFLDKGEAETMEPKVKAVSVLYSPDTGIVDTHQIMKFFETSARDKGAEFAYGIEVTGIDKSANGYKVTVQEPEGEHFSVESRFIINAAGLNSDNIASMAGLDIEANKYKVHYCKGQYFRVNNPAKFGVTHLVYPPPSNIDLGIHLTPDLAGGLRLGPDAQYTDEINNDINENDAIKFHRSVGRYLPSLKKEDIIPDTAGIRCKLQQKNEAFRDFVIKEESDKGLEGFINLIGIESPGLTSCLAIAEKTSCYY